MITCSLSSARFPSYGPLLGALSRPCFFSRDIPPSLVYLQCYTVRFLTLLKSLLKSALPRSSDVFSPALSAGACRATMYLSQCTIFTLLEIQMTCSTVTISTGSVFIGIITSEGTWDTSISSLECVSLTGLGILLMRTWALWNRNTQLAVAMGVVTLGAAVGSITLLVLWENTLVCTSIYALCSNKNCANIFFVTVSTDLDTSKAGRCSPSNPGYTIV